MAPTVAMDPPLRLELRLADTRVDPGAAPYSYRLRWADGLAIERGSATDPQAVVQGNSSTWTAVLYGGEGLDAMDVTGDRTAAERLVVAFAGVLEAEISRTSSGCPVSRRR